MFLLDDMLLRAIGISIPGLDLIDIFERIHDFALKELYDLNKINNQIKENTLLFEMGERTKEEYEKINRELLEKRGIAEKIREMDLNKRFDILGTGDLIG